HSSSATRGVRTHTSHHAPVHLAFNFPLMTLFGCSPFFLQFSACLRVLHSFPTRRSSDLTFWILSDSLILNVRRKCPAPVSSTTRSEEHTSELQSRFDLVCRLLLEKKK